MTSDGSEYHPWTVYIWAREEARRSGDRRVGTDHLLLSLLHDPAIVSILGVSLEQAREASEHLDRGALATLGLAASMDAPALAMRPVPARPTLRAVLKDRLPMSPAAKGALVAAAHAKRKNRVTAQDVLARLLDNEHPDPAADLISELDIDPGSVRARLLGR
jgi:hypothetical protein